MKRHLEERHSIKHETKRPRTIGIETTWNNNPSILSMLWLGIQSIWQQISGTNSHLDLSESLCTENVLTPPCTWQGPAGWQNLLGNGCFGTYTVGDRWLWCCLYREGSVACLQIPLPWRHQLKSWTLYETGRTKVLCVPHALYFCILLRTPFVQHLADAHRWCASILINIIVCSIKRISATVWIRT